MTKKELLQLLVEFDNDLEIVVESQNWVSVEDEKLGLYPIGISEELLLEGKILLKTSRMEVFTFEGKNDEDVEFIGPVEKGGFS